MSITVSISWTCFMIKWVKVFKNGPSKICGRQPLKYLKWYDHITSNILKAVFHKFYLVHSWISWPKWPKIQQKYILSNMLILLWRQAVEVDGLFWNIKNWISQKRSTAFPWNKNLLNCDSRTTFSEVSFI